MIKPKHIKPLPADSGFNYLADIYTKWVRHYFYFYATYHCPSPRALAPSFDTGFARLEYIGGESFNLSYMRHTRKWWELYDGLSLEDCLSAIGDEPHFSALTTAWPDISARHDGEGIEMDVEVGIETEGPPTENRLDALRRAATRLTDNPSSVSVSHSVMPNRHCLLTQFTMRTVSQYKIVAEIAEEFKMNIWDFDDYQDMWIRFPKSKLKRRRRQR